ncbi:hypothetical protein J2Z30_001711 [Streptomyces iranensis]|uniref:Uncharacterized protein n=1 Tax=Streptomyces iranensis TaxID=576784 RepID=A0ABS4MN26_9ACTN|nr:hypothetical protein [Streptomyces iranensis]
MIHPFRAARPSWGHAKACGGVGSCPGDSCAVGAAGADSRSSGVAPFGGTGRGGGSARGACFTRGAGAGDEAGRRTVDAGQGAVDARRGAVMAGRRCAGRGATCRAEGLAAAAGALGGGAPRGRPRGASGRAGPGGGPGAGELRGSGRGPWCAGDRGVRDRLPSPAHHLRTGARHSGQGGAGGRRAGGRRGGARPLPLPARLSALGAAARRPLSRSAVTAATVDVAGRAVPAAPGVRGARRAHGLRARLRRRGHPAADCRGAGGGVPLGPDPARSPESLRAGPDGPAVRTAPRAPPRPRPRPRER